MPSATLPNGGNIPRGKFELPVLAPFDSLTAGTDIPPPPDSPIEEKPIELSPKPEPEVVSVVADGTPVSPVNGHTNGAKANGASEYTGRGRTNEMSVPTSPVSITRPGSIRRFLSRKSLYSNYSSGTNGNSSQDNLSPDGMRPETPSTFSTFSRPNGKRRSSSWFRRFVNGAEPEPKRTSIVYEEKEKEALKGPPPPTLPELDQLKAKVIADDAGSLGGDDMFKNII